MTDKKKCGCGKSKDMPYCDGSHAIKIVLGGVIEQDTTIKLEEKDAPNKPDGLFETQYFTPSIEDIRVGYKCEIWWNENMLPENKWCEVKALTGDTEDFDIYDFTSRIEKNEIRVPYLTKEQIEKEGWEPERSKPARLWKKGEYGLIYGNPLVIFQLSDRDPSWQPREYTLFRGTCKDINTFRYICKLLRIN